MFKAFNGHTKTGSTLIHDGESSHGMLVEAFGLSEEIHASGETRGLPDKSNPMEPINSVHHGLKKFMRQRPSYDRNGLLNWLNLLLVYFHEPGRLNGRCCEKIPSNGHFDGKDSKMQAGY